MSVEWNEAKRLVLERYPDAWCDHVANTLAAIFYYQIRRPYVELSDRKYSEPDAWIDAYNRNLPSSADLDAVAAEEGIREATGDEGFEEYAKTLYLGDIPKAYRKHYLSQIRAAWIARGEKL